MAKSLDFKDPVLVQGMYIFKQPKVGGEGKSKVLKITIRNSLDQINK